VTETPGDLPPGSAPPCGCYFALALPTTLGNNGGEGWRLQWGRHEAGCRVPLVERIEKLERILDLFAEVAARHIPSFTLNGATVDEFCVLLQAWADGRAAE
jgi:hypothetical protein